MGDITVTAADVRLANAQQCITRNMKANATMTVGDFVSRDASGYAVKADADVLEATARAVGVIVETKDGETAVVSGDQISVCVFGPVEGFSSMTPGANAYVSKTAGKIDHTKPTGGAYQQAVGRAESATCLFVNPVLADPSSV